MKIKRITPRALARVLGLLYGLLGFVGGFIVFLISLSTLAFGKQADWLGLAAVILGPIGYGVLGFILGYFTAWTYNFVAKRVGGIEIEVE